jgi:hypothetical protein
MRNGLLNPSLITYGDLKDEKNKFYCLVRRFMSSIPLEGIKNKFYFEITSSIKSIAFVDLEHQNFGDKFTEIKLEPYEFYDANRQFLFYSVGIKIVELWLKRLKQW